MNDLFRREAFQHAARRLSGSVMLAMPMSARILGSFFGGILVTALIFASLATYARKAAVMGWLVPDLGLIRATVPSAGFIRALSVKEGDEVKKGARLAEIQVSTVTESGDAGDNMLAQLRAEADAAAANARIQIERLEAESAQDGEKAKNRRLELDQLRNQAELQTQRVEIAQVEAARAVEIAAKGLLLLRERDARRSAALASMQDLQSLRRQIAASESDLSGIEARMSTIRIEKEVAAAEAWAARAALQQRLIDAESRRVQVAVSPVDGRVAALPIVVGQPVPPGATIAVIVPTGAVLEGELLAPSRAAGFIRSGQQAHLMLKAYPHERFGVLKGEIKSVSSTILDPSDLSIPGVDIHEPVFRVRVRLSSDEIRTYGERIPLQPGLLLSADIVFDRRSLIKWLLDPLFAVAERS